MIEAGATNPRLTEEGGGSVFRIVGRDDLQGVIGGDYLAHRWRNSNIAIVHDTSAFGEGLAEEVKKRLNQRGVRETRFTTYPPGAMDYSDLLEQLRAASIEVLYLGGYSPAAGLLVRQARDREYSVQLVAGDPLSTGEFWLVAGPAREGTLFTSFSDPMQEPRAAEIMSRVLARLSSPMQGRSIAMQRMSSGRRRSSRQARRTRPGSPRCCARSSSTRCSAPSVSTPRATLLASIRSNGTSGPTAGTYQRI